MQFIELLINIDDVKLLAFTSKIQLFNEWKKSGTRHIHVVYHKENIDNILHCSGVINIEEYEMYFEDYVNRFVHNSQSLNILAATYQLYSKEAIKKIITTKLNDTNEFINQLLRESNGYLIYKHQFEELMKSQFNIDQNEAIFYRSDWNKKVQNLFKKLIITQFDDNRTLYDLIIAKSVSNQFYPMLSKTDFKFYQ